MRKKGYAIHVYFLFIPTISLALKRIADRVSLGGHNILEPVVRRRYQKGLYNLFNVYMPLSDYCGLFDNSSIDPPIVFEYHQGKEAIIRPEIYENIKRQLRKT